MATIACSGCGLPRVAAEADTPCPVCEAGVHDLPASPVSAAASFPTDGMAADVSQLTAAADQRPHGHRPEMLAGVFGVALGAVLVLAIQGFLPSHAPATIPEPGATAAIETPPVAPVVVPPIEEPTAVAPPAAVALELAPAPRLAPEEALPAENGPQYVIDVNRPDGSLTFPPSGIWKPGMRAVLRGRLNSLVVSSIDGGSVIDASGLVCQKVVIHKVESRSVVKVNAPQGLVNLYGPVTGKSEVVIQATGGEVSVRATWGSDKNRARVEGSSRVAITAARVEFLQAVSGAGTQVDVTLANAGTLKMVSVQDSAVVEYRKTNAGDTAPHIELGDVAKNATVRRAR